MHQVHDSELTQGFEAKLNKSSPVVNISRIKAPTLRVFYTSPEILASHSYCINNKYGQSIVTCSNIRDMFLDMYSFDRMLSKMMDAAAAIIHRQDLQIVFTNDIQILKLFRISEGSQIRFRYDGKHSWLVFDISKYKATITPGKRIDYDTSGDDLYDDIAAALVNVIIHKTNYEVRQSSYRIAVDSVLEQLLKIESSKVKVDLSGTSFKMEYCYELESIDSHKINDLKTGTFDLDSFCVLHAIVARCRQIEYANPVLLIEAYALIPEGLSVDMGTQHYNLPYVQSMIDYIKDDFEPYYMRYVKSICRDNDHMTCKNHRGNLLISNSHEHDMLFHGTKADLLGDGIAIEAL